MKINLISFLIVIIVCFSCQKYDEEAASNVNGTWIGEWKGIESQGTWLANFSNDGTRINGDAIILSYCDISSNQLCNYWPTKIDGLAFGDNISFKASFNSTELDFKGKIDNDSIKKGVFALGTWVGRKLPILEISVVDSFEITQDGWDSKDIVFDETKNLLYISQAGSISKINKKKEIIGSFNFRLTSRFCYDNGFFWLYNDNAVIYKSDTVGNRTYLFDTRTEFKTYSSCRPLTVYGDDIILVRNETNQIYKFSKVDPELELLCNNKYLPINYICKYKNGFLATGPINGTIFYLEVVKGILMPVKAIKINCFGKAGIATDGEYIYCLGESSYDNVPLDMSFGVVYILKAN